MIIREQDADKCVRVWSSVARRADALSETDEVECKDDVRRRSARGAKDRAIELGASSHPVRFLDRSSGSVNNLTRGRIVNGELAIPVT